MPQTAPAAHACSVVILVTSYGGSFGRNAHETARSFAAFKQVASQRIQSGVRFDRTLAGLEAAQQRAIQVQMEANAPSAEVENGSTNATVHSMARNDKKRIGDLVVRSKGESGRHYAGI
jgi:hypothetical protein